MQSVDQPLNQRNEQSSLELADNLQNQILYVLEFDPLAVSFVSISYERIWGRPSQLLKENPFAFLDAVHPEDRPILEAAIGQQVQGLETSVEYRIIKPSGDIRWIHDTTSPVFSVSGLHLRSTGIAEDITEQKIFQVKLENDEAKFRTMANAVPQIVWSSLPSGVTEFFNQRWYDFTGIPFGQTSGSWLDFLHLDDRDRASKLWADSLASGDPFELVLRLRSRDETFVWTLSRALPVFNQNQEVTRWMGTFTEIHEQKTLHDALKQSEERYRLLTEVSPQLIWTTDVSGIITYENQVCLNWIGPASEAGAEFLLAFHSTLHEDDREIFCRAWNEAWQGKVDFAVEVRLKNTQLQSYFWHKLMTNPVKDSSGECIQWVGVGINIHDEKIVRLQVEAEKQKFECIFNNSPAAMALLRGPTLIFEMVNPKYQALLPGRTLLGRAFLEVVHEPEGLAFYALLKNVFDTGQVFNAKEMPAWAEEPEGVFRDAFYDLCYSLVSDGQGAPYGVYVNAIDVSERVLARQRIEESERRYFKAKEQLSMAIVVSKVGFFDLDLISKTYEFSEQIFKDWGLDRNSSLKEAIAHVHPDDREKVRQLVLNSRTEGTTYRTQYRVIRPDGSMIWTEAQGIHSYDARGKPTRFFGTSVDISAQMQAQIALEQAMRDAELAKNEAEKANSSKSSFLANMSHEIRTPMSSVLGFAEVLRKKNLSENERLDALNRIDRSGRSLLQLIDDILDISKVEAGKLAIVKSRFSPADMIKDVTSLFHLQVEQKNIHLNLVIDPCVPQSARADPIRLRQVLVNLLGNAVKFTPRGTVTIEVSAKSDLKLKTETLLFQITDTGIGISEADQEKIFQPFAQADASISRNFGGTGLGLVLSKRLAQQMDGDIELLSSQENVGSRFLARIEAGPFHTDPGPEVVESSPEDQQMCLEGDYLKGAHVLVVDDLYDNRLLMRFYLEEAGASVETASDGEEAIIRAMNGNYDVILMDIQMAGVDGIQATRRLRSLGYAAPILALTAHAMQEEIKRSLESGFDEHLTKPVQARSLLATISKYLPADKHTPSLMNLGREAGLDSGASGPPREG